MAYNNFFGAESFKNVFDFNQPFNTLRRNCEAMTAASQAWVEGIQAVTRRNAEVARDNMEQGLRATREMFQSGSPENGISRLAECSCAIIENNFNAVREAFETLSKSGFEAGEMLKNRASESINEASRAAAPRTPPAQRCAKPLRLN